MRTLIPLALVAAFARSLVLAHARKPHLLVLLVDDLGYYDVPWKNPRQTKTESLAKFVREEAVQLERFYTYKCCSPTRSSLLSGRFPIHVNEDNPKGVGVVGGIDLQMTLLPQKLKAQGYMTAFVGKWHLGARSKANLPANRGFDYHLGFLTGREDHNSQRCPAAKYYVDLWENHGPAYGKNGTNACYLYGRRAVEIINEHDPSKPLFLYLAFQELHEPLQALAWYIDHSVPYVRRKAQGMIACIGDATYNLTRALKSRGMWNDTLLIWASDNGGPQYTVSNNYPLRGGKGTDFEGGVRVPAFAAGGFLHSSLRGGVLTTPLHIADLYPTFCLFGGGKKEHCMHDRAAGIPDVDGIDIGKAFTTSEGNSSRSSPMILSSNAYIDGDWKYVQSSPPDHHCKGSRCGYWTGPDWPVDESYIPLKEDPGCHRDGCLFHIGNDPEERHELSSKYPSKQLEMKHQLSLYVAGRFQTNSTGGYDDCISVDQFAAEHQGFTGPLCKQGTGTLLIEEPGEEVQECQLGGSQPV